MKESRTIMGMPIELEVLGPHAKKALSKAFDYLAAVDIRFSTYKSESEISRINRGELAIADASDEMQEVFAIAEKTKAETNGYFDVRRPDGELDPSGIVKGWSILAVEQLVLDTECKDYFLNVGGDIASGGSPKGGAEWSIGIRNPFVQSEIVKVVYPHGKGVATSGPYERGAQIYNPHNPKESLDEIMSITVIGPNVLEADRFATAAFAMGKAGIAFIENRSGLEAYAIDSAGTATLTSGFEEHT